MTWFGDNLIPLRASPNNAGNFVQDVLDKSSLSEINGPVDIECSSASGSPSVNVRKKVKSTGQRTRYPMRETIYIDCKNSPFIFIVSCIFFKEWTRESKISWYRILLFPVGTFLHILAETHWIHWQFTQSTKVHSFQNEKRTFYTYITFQCTVIRQWSLASTIYSWSNLKNIYTPLNFAHILYAYIYDV